MNWYSRTDGEPLVPSKVTGESLKSNYSRRVVVGAGGVDSTKSHYSTEIVAQPTGHLFPKEFMGLVRLFHFIHYRERFEDSKGAFRWVEKFQDFFQDAESSRSTTLLEAAKVSETFVAMEKLHKFDMVPIPKDWTVDFRYSGRL